MRTKRWRRILTPCLWLLPALRADTQLEAVIRDFSIGISLGRLGYRLWYGVLRPLPGPAT